MLYKYIDKILSFCDKAERQNWTTYEAIQYIKDNIKRLSDDELDEMSAYYTNYTRRMDDDPEPWTDNPRAS